MKKTIKFCASFDYNTSAVEEVHQLYKKIMHARDLCVTAQKEANQTKLEEAIKYCDRMKYNCDLVAETRSFCLRVTRINEEARKANKTLHEEHCKVVVKAANEIKMTSKTIKHIRKLVNGPYDVFLNAQYD